MAKDLVNEPGGSLTPDKLAKRAVAGGGAAGFEVEVWDEKRVKAEKLGGLLGVNRGSVAAAPASWCCATSRKPHGTRGPGRQGHHVRLRAACRSRRATA